MREAAGWNFGRRLAETRVRAGEGYFARGLGGRAVLPGRPELHAAWRTTGDAGGGRPELARGLAETQSCVGGPGRATLREAWAELCAVGSDRNSTRLGGRRGVGGAGRNSRAAWPDAR
jgi:hypothetical protein